ncbi:sigma-70 family RNA polymerase sigma factor [Streptomyces glycanivorans]|uniref:Sigma-70 family RNA polymerase sigma factor n=1 Tax=Streptomyces glycanivorans TaxID=3033808 RepID=A0ABY9JNV9_9ACTN|nr:sigma-70 family RNA polymerase sigma factor [Streptomyces sp. Alt3]WLQ69392.1 sigma-70 family RNA polymerase sigma factor [Streptomyces sp. Alt3]
MTQSSGGPYEDRSVEEQIQHLKSREKHFKRVIEKRIARGHIDDVWQEALLHMFKRLQSGPPVAKLDAYMATVCVNAATDLLRQLGRQADAFAGGDLDEFSETGIVIDFDRDVDLVRVQSVMREELTPQQHKVYILKHYYGLDSRSIAELVGAASDSAVRQMIRAANRRLREPAVMRRLAAED